MTVAARPPRHPWRGVLVPAAGSAVLQGGLGAGLAAHGLAGVAVPYLLLAAAGIAALVGAARLPPLVAVVGATTIGGLLLVPGPPVGLIPLIAALVGAAARGARWWALGTAVGALVLPALELAVTRNAVFAARAVGECLALGAAVGVGEAVRVRRQRASDARAAAAAEARMAAERERVRIARELHDVLAHSLSAISVQAGVGLHLAASRPDAAREALEAIRSASTTALAEVRGVIGLLRGDEHAPRAPEPDLDAVAALVADAAALGLDAALDDRLRPRPAPSVQLALFRVVQESLTNAGRHAAGRRVRVTLERDGKSAVARVRDAGGAAAPALPAAPAGRGLIGMRERAELQGGTLELVPHPDGLEVVARIPDPSAA